MPLTPSFGGSAGGPGSSRTLEELGWPLAASSAAAATASSASASGLASVNTNELMAELASRGASFPGLGGGGGSSTDLVREATELTDGFHELADGFVDSADEAAALTETVPILKAHKARWEKEKAAVDAAIAAHHEAASSPPDWAGEAADEADKGDARG